MMFAHDFALARVSSKFKEGGTNSSCATDNSRLQDTTRVQDTIIGTLN